MILAKVGRSQEKPKIKQIIKQINKNSKNVMHTGSGHVRGGGILGARGIWRGYNNENPCYNRYEIVHILKKEIDRQTVIDRERT